MREVGLFTTRIERGDGNAVFVPNSQIWSNPVINYSSGGTQRIEVEVELAQRKDVDAAIGELKKLVADEPRVLSGTTLGSGGYGGELTEVGRRKAQDCGVGA